MRPRCSSQFEALNQYIQDVAARLDHLLQVEFRAILFAHGTPLVTAAHSRLAQLLA